MKFIEKRFFSLTNSLGSTVKIFLVIARLLLRVTLTLKLTSKIKLKSTEQSETLKKLFKIVKLVAQSVNDTYNIYYL